MNIDETVSLDSTCIYTHIIYEYSHTTYNVCIYVRTKHRDKMNKGEITTLDLKHIYIHIMYTYTCTTYTCVYIYTY